MFRRLLLTAAIAAFVPALVVRPVFADEDKKPEKCKLEEVKQESLSPLNLLQAAGSKER